MRKGPLAGAASWSHEYGDVANTLTSTDRSVRLPLGLLWFGGNCNADILPRHGHGPPEQVVGGRLFIETMDGLNARDVYTGRELWTVKIPDMVDYGVYFDDSYLNLPLKVIGNQRHIPGANARGTNYVATADAIYAAAGSKCRVLDPKTGAAVKTFELPCKPGQKVQPELGYIGVYQDVLLAGWGFGKFAQKPVEPSSASKEGSAKPSADTVAAAAAGKSARKGEAASRPPGLRGSRLTTRRMVGGEGEEGIVAVFVNVSASDGLVAFDRHNGKLLWQVEARHSFLHNGIVAGGGRVYCLDRLPASVEQTLARSGPGKPSDYRILALDAKSGTTCWQIANDVFGTWLGYSEARDILLQAGALPATGCGMKRRGA